MGSQQTNPNSAAFGLNTKPPRELWNNIDATARVIDRLRDVMGAPITTLSAYRSPAYNKAIAGAAASQHVEFRAIDFYVKSNSGPADWAAALRQMRSDGTFTGGIGTYPSFVHVDTRGHNADW
jgi:lysozyme